MMMDVTHNTEHVFLLELDERKVNIVLDKEEHLNMNGHLESRLLKKFFLIQTDRQFLI